MTGVNIHTFENFQCKGANWNGQFEFSTIDVRFSIMDAMMILEMLTDQRIVGNSLQAIDVIITANPIHQSFILRVTIDVIGQCGYITKQDFPSIL